MKSKLARWFNVVCIVNRVRHRPFALTLFYMAIGGQSWIFYYNNSLRIENKFSTTTQGRMHLTYNGMRIVVCTVQGRLQLTYTVLRTEHKVTTPTLADQGIGSN